MPVGSVCAALLCHSSPISRLLHCGVLEQSAVAADARTRRVRQIADTGLYHNLSLSLSLSLSLAPSLSHCWRRLLLSTAWESVAMRHAASALLAVAAARLLFLVILAREGGGKPLREMYAWTWVMGGSCAHKCVCMYVAAPSRRSS